MALRDNSVDSASSPTDLSVRSGDSEEPGEPPGDGPRIVEVGADLGDRPRWSQRLREVLIGRPRDLADQSLFQHVSLIAFLAWVGLGADGLSSSCYGPPEAFANLHEHRYLAVPLAAAIMLTVFVISACYSHIIEEFPSGGGGYLVASKLLGNRIGVISGCALLVDYVLTITVSIAAAGDALFGLASPALAAWKLPVEFAAIGLLILLNLRGVKESVQVLMPIFLLFLLTHTVLIGGSLALHVPQALPVARELTAQTRAGLDQFGFLALLLLLLHAYSLGAGTFTGIEAVSNSMPVMREPRVATAKKTMRYMAFSLALTAGGLIVAYLLLNIEPEEGKTLNHVLTLRFVGDAGLGGNWLGTVFTWTVLLTEGSLLFVAAQAGFIDGPRVLANMAHDSWMPRWFGNLSERLATENGIVLMGLAALAALAYTGGEVSALVIMYSINVFVTFSLSMLGMCRHWWSLRGRDPIWRRRLALFAAGAAMCVTILAITVVEKFNEGAWRTLAVTGGVVAVCFLVHRYYRNVGRRLKALDQALRQVPTSGPPTTAAPDPGEPTAIVLVGGFNGLGVHTMLNAVRYVPKYFRNYVFLSVGVIDSGNFKGAAAMDELRQYTESSLKQYEDLSRRLGLPAASFMSIGTDAVDELERLCREAARRFPRSLIFAGQLVFQKDTWIHRLLHNQTAFSLQRRLQWAGLPMIILPTRVQ